ncbi:unnamed protein product [Eretmochelys imbricata]
MASALTVLLLEGSYPKPSISASPGGVIPMGGNFTIHCQHEFLGMRFLLCKDGDGNYLTYTDPAGSEAEFPITSTSLCLPPRKGAAPRPSSPLGALKAPAQQDHASINEGKEPQTLPQEPDPGADGLTYAELDGQVLQAKPGSLALAHEPAQLSMYAAINVSWGAPQ